MPPVQIIPALLCKTRKEFLEKLRKVEPFVKKVQVDIMDGKFVPNRTIQAKDLRGLKTKVKMEIQLMVKEPAKYVDDFAKLGAYTIIFHIESCSNDAEVIDLIEQIKAKGMKPGIALNPGTPLSRIKPYLKLVKHILIMTVNPGFGGQKFIKGMLRKIIALRRLNKKIDIEVDGGINPETAKLARKAGANLLVAGMAIFGGNDVKKAVGELKKS